MSKVPNIDPGRAAVVAGRVRDLAKGAARPAGGTVDPKLVANVAGVAMGLLKEIDKDEAKAFVKTRLPKSQKQVLSERIAATVAQTSVLIRRQDPSASIPRHAQEWRRRAVGLQDRLAIDVAREKRRTHLAAIKSDLDALQDEMNAGLG